MSETPTESEASTEVDSIEDRGASFRVHAQVSGRFIIRFAASTLSKIDKTPDRGIFTFLTRTSEGVKKLAFNEGDECSTLYGPAKVLEYRQKQNIVVVEMVGWKATGYLRDDTLKVIPKSLFRSLLQQFGSHETQKPLEFPHAEGTLVPTPFGQGSVVRPVPVTGKGRRETATRVPPTNGIALDSWTLWNEPYTFLHG